MLARFRRSNAHAGADQAGGPTQDAQPPRWLHQRSSKWFVILTASYAVFVDIFLYGAIVPVIPFALSRRVGIPQEEVQHWVAILLAIYGAGLLVTSYAAGWIVDHFQVRKWSYWIGLVFLLAATVMLMLARSITLLIIGRIFQAMSAGVVWTVATVLMTDRVGADGTGEAMGYVTFGRSVAIVIGPLIGGVVYANAGYYAVFGISFGFEFFDIVLRFLLIETREAQKWDPSIGPPRLSTAIQDAEKPQSNDQSDLAVQVGNKRNDDAEKGLDGPSSEVPHPRPISPPDSTHSEHLQNEMQPDSASPAAINSNDEGQSKTTTFIDRLPPMLTLLLIPRMIVALVGVIFQSIVLTSFDATLPLFVKATFGWNSNGAGLIFLALVVPSFVSPLIGYLSDRWGGVRWWVAMGYVTSCVPLIVLRIVDHNSLHDKIVLAALLAFLGGFNMLFEIPLWVEIIKVMEEATLMRPERYEVNGGGGAIGQVYGLTNFFFSAGMIIGPIWGGYVYQAAGWGTMTLSLGIVLGAMAVPTVLWTGGWLFDAKSRRPGSDKQKESSLERGS